MFPNSSGEPCPLHTCTSHFLSQAVMLHSTSRPIHCGVYHIPTHRSLPLAISFLTSKRVPTHVSIPELTHAGTGIGPNATLIPYPSCSARGHTWTDIHKDKTTSRRYVHTPRHSRRYTCIPLKYRVGWDTCRHTTFRRVTHLCWNIHMHICLSGR